MKTRISLSLSVLFISATLVWSQNSNSGKSAYAPEKLTDQDYARAEKQLSNALNDLVFGTVSGINWIDQDQFTYRVKTTDGNKTFLVNAKKKTRTEQIDERSANRGFRDFGPRNGILSPDGTKSAFIRDNNLWMKDMNSNTEKQLTFDGIEDYGYATNNAGWTRSDSPVLTWSPDSKMIATFQHDARGVGEMYLVTTNVGHPKLEAWKYPLPEDSVIFRISRVIIHTDPVKVVRLNMEPDQHRSSMTDHIAIRGGGFADVEWSEDSKVLAFLSNSRDHKDAFLRIADPFSGSVRTVLEEHEDTFFESGEWYLLKNSNEFIWYSQKSDWGHLYLYDLSTGNLKNQITQGKWKMSGIDRIDQKNRKIYFTGMGKEPGDPYFQYYYSVNFDGSDLRLLSPDSANHSVSLSPEGDWLVDTWSTPSQPPVVSLRNSKGKKVMDLEKADITRLLATGWQAPLQFSVKARDGKTDLYGMMFVPIDFDQSKKYPIINSIYPGPQSGSVGSRSFSAARGDRQALAELGFIVITLDAMGTPNRSKSFHEAYYGNMGDNGLPDHITGMEQLAERFDWIDLDRVGIYGHSGGGFASTDAILRYPDFFHVAVSGAGNHDQRNYEDDWGEKWHGLLKTNPDGSTNYDDQANQNHAANLKGHLLLAHGTMDGNVPYYNTLLVVNELIAANKDFDLILFPNRGHGFGNEPYMMRRRWDYFVKHLLGAEPPDDYEFGKLK